MKKTIYISSILPDPSGTWKVIISLEDPSVDGSEHITRVVDYPNIIDHVKSDDENISHNAQEALIHEVLQDSDIMVLDYSQFTYKFGRYIFMNEDYLKEILELNKNL